MAKLVMLFILTPLSLLLLLLATAQVASSYDGSLYDSSAYTECKKEPVEPLYGGGILKDRTLNDSFLLQNLNQSVKYCFSIWVKIDDEASAEAVADSALVRASLDTEEATLKCIGSVTAKKGCWSFLKGGFVLSSPSTSAKLYLQTSDGGDVKVEAANASLQPFTDEQWRLNQEEHINKARKRAVTIHVSDRQGRKIQGASITVEQVSRDFPFGSAIASTIIGNPKYQKWFNERFNAAVFENELKWYATEAVQGKTNYTVADKMVEFVRANKITARGHNIFWEDPQYNPVE